MFSRTRNRHGPRRGLSRQPGRGGEGEGEGVLTIQPGFLFDAAKCTGCEACVVACSLENDLGGESWRQVVTQNEAHHPDIPVVHLSIACNHCRDAPCMEACPALAYSKDSSTGVVTLDADRCIGCRYCSWACPYDAPRFSETEGVMTKCTFCGHRQAEGLAPACVEQCPTGALGFGELATLPGVLDAPGMPTLAPGPSIRFIPKRGDVVESASVGSEGSRRAPSQSTVEPARKITLRSEWPLVGFSFLAAWLVAIHAASALGAPALPPWLFLGLVATSLSLSSLHLGKKLRAWRAILNFRRSWLSREVVLYSAFVGLATVHILFFSGAWRLAAATAGVGFAALFAVDRVYDIVRTERRMHSADVVRTAILLTGLWLGHLPWSVAFAALKLYLYVGRKLRMGVGYSVVSLARIGAGFVFPVVMFQLDRERWQLWALVGTAVGEFIDRCEFYTELRVATPRAQMAQETKSFGF